MRNSHKLCLYGLFVWNKNKVRRKRQSERKWYVKERTEIGAKLREIDENIYRYVTRVDRQIDFKIENNYIDSKTTKFLDKWLGWFI